MKISLNTSFRTLMCFAFGVMALFFTTQYSAATLLVYDGFETPGDYVADASIDGVGGGTGSWTTNWAVGSGTINTVENSIPVSGLVEDSGRIVTNPDLDGSVDLRRSFNASDFTNLGNEIWFSYVFNRQAGTNNNNFFITGSASSTRYFGLRSENTPNNEFKAAIRFAGSTVEKSTAAVTLTDDTNYFVIGRMAFNAIGNDRLDVWVNPSNFSSVANLGSADMFVETANTYSAFADVWIANGANASYEFDEIRIGSTLGDTAPVPEPSSTALLLGGTGLVLLTFRRRRSLFL